MSLKVSLDIGEKQIPMIELKSSKIEFRCNIEFIMSFTMEELEVLASRNVKPTAISELCVNVCDSSLDYKDFYLNIIPKLQKIGMSAYDDASGKKEDKKEQIEETERNISDHIEEFKGISIPKRRVNLGDREQAIAFALMLASEFGKE